jgi:hypothetical protein
VKYIEIWLIIFGLKKIFKFSHIFKFGVILGYFFVIWLQKNYTYLVDNKDEWSSKGSNESLDHYAAYKIWLEIFDLKKILKFNHIFKIWVIYHVCRVIIGDFRDSLAFWYYIMYIYKNLNQKHTFNKYFNYNYLFGRLYLLYLGCMV